MKKETINYRNEFNRQMYDRIGIMLPKGEKAVWQEKATKQGLSLSQFIQNAVALYIKNYTDNTQLCKNDMQNEKEPQNLIQ